MSDLAEKTKQLNEAIQAIKNKFEPILQALKAKGEKLKEDAPKPETVEAVINVDFDVTWKDVDIIFDVPSVTMKEQTLSFDIPETTMKLQTFSWDRPDICMEYVDLPWPLGGLHLPKPCMKREEIKLHIPEFTMKTQEVIMHIPEFTMERVEWKIGLPQITIKNVKVETEKIKARGDEIKTEAEAIAADMKREVDAAVSQVYGNAPQVRESFDSALHQISSAIDDASKHGLDPIKMPGDGGDINLRKMYAQLLEQRDATINKISENSKMPDNQAFVRIEDAVN